MRISDWSSDVCSSDLQDNIYNTTPALTINDNHVPAFAYLDLAGSIDATEQFRFFWSIENLLDKDPAPTPYAVLNVPTNRSEERRDGKECVSTGRSRW